MQLESIPLPSPNSSQFLRPLACFRPPIREPIGANRTLVQVRFGASRASLGSPQYSERWPATAAWSPLILPPNNLEFRGCGREPGALAGTWLIAKDFDSPEGAPELLHVQVHQLACAVPLSSRLNARIWGGGARTDKVAATQDAEDGGSRQHDFVRHAMRHSATSRRLPVRNLRGNYT
jgi:hypothetical protein